MTFTKAFSWRSIWKAYIYVEHD